MIISISIAKKKKKKKKPLEKHQNYQDKYTQHTRTRKMFLQPNKRCPQKWTSHGIRIN